MSKRINSCDGAYDSLDVRFTKACDNRCPYCIEADGIEALPEASAEDMAAATIRTGIRSVLILGGEPLLQLNKVLDYVTLIRNDVDTIYLTTSLPKTIEEHKGTFAKLMSLLDGLNVSIQAVDPEENNNLFCATSRHNRLELLRWINSIWRSKVRVSINLVKGGIDSMYKLVCALRTLNRDYHCGWIKINELQHAEDLYVSYEEIMGKRLGSPYSTGCQTEIHVPGVTAKLTLKRSCFLTESSRKASWGDLLKAFFGLWYTPKNKFAVLYEDAAIHDGWMKRKRFSTGTVKCQKAGNPQH